MNTKNFTLRLNDEESAALEKLRQFFSKNTDAAAVKFAIKNFQHYYDRTKKAESECRRQEAENEKLKEDIRDFVFSFQGLNKHLP